MVRQVEIIGDYNVMKLPNGMYRVSVNNGNIGAGLWDEASVIKLREKYGVNTASHSLPDIKYNSPVGSKMPYDEARKIFIHGSGEVGFHNIKLFDEAINTLMEHESNRVRGLFKDKLPGGLWTGALFTLA